MLTLEWLNYLQATVLFVFYDILLLADYSACLPFSRQSPLPSFSNAKHPKPYLVLPFGLITQLGTQLISLVGGEGAAAILRVS